jgi:hypothetical protein
MIKFKVEVNPFLRKAVINSKIGKILYTKIIYYEDIEEWNSFEFGDKTFDIEFKYEAEFLVSIYPVENNKVDYTKPYKVELTFKMTD